jgi:lysophospholipase L1-like esterase
VLAKALHVKAWFLVTVCLGLCAVLGGIILVGESRSAGDSGESGFGFEDGDRIVFIGDSITRQCLFTQYLESYCYARYPERRLHFRNAGVGGDRTANVLERFDDDIASFEPDHAFVLMGMNDGGLRDFDSAFFEKYRKGMGRLMDRLEAMDVRVIAISPTMFDLQSAKATREARGEEWNPDADRYNAVLAYYGAWLREECARRGHAFVDVHGPLNEETFRGREEDGAYTLIGDGVHPDAAGHEVIVDAILEQMGERRGAGALVLARRGEAWEAVGGRQGLVRLETEERMPVFVYRAEGLPSRWDGDRSDRLIISGLAPGRYELRIDGDLAGVWDATQLGQGIGLGTQPGTPPYVQAQQVIGLNAQRNKEVIKRLRDAWYEVKVKWYEFEESPGAFEDWFSGKRTELVDLELLADEFVEKIYAANPPKAHEYRLRRLEGGSESKEHH